MVLFLHCVVSLKQENRGCPSTTEALKIMGLAELNFKMPPPCTEALCSSCWHFFGIPKREPGFPLSIETNSLLPVTLWLFLLLAWGIIYLFIICLFSRRTIMLHLQCFISQTKFKLLLTSTCTSALISSGFFLTVPLGRVSPPQHFLNCWSTPKTALILSTFSKWCCQDLSSGVLVNQSQFFIEKNKQ